MFTWQLLGTSKFYVMYDLITIRNIEFKYILCISNVVQLLLLCYWISKVVNEYLLYFVCHKKYLEEAGAVAQWVKQWLQSTWVLFGVPGNDSTPC